jgi:ATP-dependent helicase/nuclease subunit A
MSEGRHLLVRASAGTGKTYRLTSRYLALLLGGADPGGVLATTFTRKAAHEILERVLERLAAAARGGEALAKLREAVGRDATAEECLEVLSRLLRGMDRIRVGTIDSFFVQLARLFALDLGLPPGWRIADEAEADSLRSEAVGDAVAGAEKLELLDLLRDLQRQAIGQSAHEELLRFAGEGREALLESGPGAWERIRALPDVAPEDLRAAVAALPGLPLPTTKAGKARKLWADSRAKLLDRIERGDWASVLEVGLVKKICAGQTTYNDADIEPVHLEFVRPIVDHALHVLTERVAIRNHASRALLERFEASYRKLGREQGRLGFHDLPDALAPVSGADPLAARGVDLAHRLDGRIDHLLLDEFQDTAPVQWRVLRPLADGILADEGGKRSFFCVGDEKQSIYGWRAAEPRLLRGLAEKRPSLGIEELHRSYRSSRAVLGAVNTVFGSIATNPALEERDAEVIDAAREFQRSFVAHEPACERPGAVFLLRAGAPADGKAEHSPALELAVERVRAILADAPLATVGILLRRRRWIPQLIHRLRETGIAASDEGGNPLTDSIAVLHALSLLHLADHPGDLAAAFHVATSPLGSRVGLAAEGFREDAGTAARAVRAALAERGFGGFLASIRPGAGEGYGGWDLERYGQLVDLALAWEGRAGSRPRTFVEHVRKTKVEDARAAQVRVMTVHGAKGLEFDAVVLPELDRSMLHGEQGLLTLRPDPEGPIEKVSHGMPKEIARAHAELEEMRADVARRRMVEELCVLYVAMTRAVHRLDLIVQARDKEGGGLTHAAILRGALRVEAAGGEGVAWEHPEGTSPWFRSEIAETRSAEEERAASEEGSAAAKERRALRLAPSRRPRSLPALSPSRAKDLGSVRASSLLLPRDAITARGRLVHRMLEEVEWIETFDRSDEDVLAIVRRLESDEKLLTAALAEFRAALARPETRRVLSRPKGEVELWRERPFALVMPGPDASEALWTGAFDRVVIRREGGRTVSAGILDFKTDRVEGEALKGRAESYRPQMEAYRRALARMIGLAEGAIEARLVFLGPDVVVDV